VNTPQNIVECPTYSEKFIRDTVDAPFVPTSVVIFTLPRCTCKEPDTCTTHFVDSNHLTSETCLLQCQSYGCHACLPSAARGDLVDPLTRRQLGRRAFAVAGPNSCNSLRVNICNKDKVCTFKTRLKMTHLFDRFPTVSDN